MLYLCIFLGWVLTILLVLRFFSVCSNKNRAFHNITWDEIKELDFFIADEAIKFTGLDHCITGIDQRGFLIYEYEKILDYFQEEGMSLEEAVEYIDFNVIGIKPDNYTIHYSKP